MKSIASVYAPAAVGPYSQAIQVDNLLFCSGQLGIDPATKKLVSDSMEAQVLQVFKNIAAVLAAAGINMSHVVKTTVFLKSMDDFAKMNALYEEAFGSHKPARSTIQVAKLPLDAWVEIECVAVVKR
jgi:2-iminobutanoate/2-iminopropanoate deaminase